MTVRAKTLLIIGLTLVGLVLIVFALTRWVFMSSYLDLEEREVMGKVKQARLAMDRDLRALDVLVADWGGWDDTYGFMNAIATGDASTRSAVRLSS